MTEGEIMEQHSATVHDRVTWALEATLTAANGRWVFHHRMSGCSDDGKRVIGKNHTDLPGSVYFDRKAA